MKHKDDGGYNFTSNQLPIHLVKELEIIEAMMEKAGTKLKGGSCQNFLIVSDHGASRLAVLRKKEEKYETDTKGEHSGRCCKLFSSYDLPFAAEENGYLSLADYGRFKGSRAANVEVHGGATLEEVVVPIIVLQQKNKTIVAKLEGGDDPILFDRRNGIEVKLFINHTSTREVSVRLKDAFYPAKRIRDNHYLVKLSDIRRAGDHFIDVYMGDDLITKQLLLKVQARSGKINDTFDQLF